MTARIVSELNSLCTNMDHRIEMDQYYNLSSHWSQQMYLYIQLINCSSVASSCNVDRNLLVRVGRCSSSFLEEGDLGEVDLELEFAIDICAIRASSRMPCFLSCHHKLEDSEC